MFAHLRPDWLRHFAAAFQLMSHTEHVANAIAMVVAAGPLNETEIVERISRLLGQRWRWIHRLARRIEESFGGRCRPQQRLVKELVANDASFRRALANHDITVDGQWLCQPRMCPMAGASDAWQLPQITTIGQLGDWLSVPTEELIWLADLHGAERNVDARFRRYRYRLLAKGMQRFRLIEVPIFRLKSLQRQILLGILNHIPPHEATHGFRTGRSIRTFAEPHQGHDVVSRMDLADFFPSIRYGRVAGLFRLAGYPDGVANLLAAIATNTVPDAVLESENALRPPEHLGLQQRYGVPHLPQGAPTSPAIANLCAYRLDCRLSGLAESCGAVYTRYADDLAFSGDGMFARNVHRVQHHIAAIALDEGFCVNYRKTRIMRRATRQRITGIVVNQHSNIARHDYDRLKAILHNCRTSGPESQNRDRHSNFRAHLTGRVAFVESINPQRGARLRRMLACIEW